MSDLKSVLIIGGRANQLPLIRKAKEKYRVVVCEIADDTPGRLYADAYYCVSEQTIDSVASIARKEMAFGVLTNSEPLLSLAEGVCELLGLPQAGDEAIKLLTDKCLMRDYLTDYEEYSVPHRLCANVDDAIDFFSSLKRTAIIKPVDSSASRGVHTVKSATDINRLFPDAQRYSRDKTSVLIEEYIEGTEFTTDGIVTSDGKHVTLAISQKEHYKYNRNVACELFFSHHNPTYDYDQLREVNDRIVELSGLALGMTHAEYKFDGTRFRLIEMMARGGGTFIASDIVPFMSGVDSYGRLIDMAVGERVNIDGIDDRHMERCAVLKFFDVQGQKSGIVKKVYGAELLDRIPQIIKHELFFGVGDCIKPAEDDSKRIGYYIACANDRIQLGQVINRVENEFRIECEDAL